MARFVRAEKRDEEDALILLRRLLGDALRRQRLHQERTLRDVSAGARVSLGYLSEIERGQKEASSELLAAICNALGVQMSSVLREVSEELQSLEATQIPALVPIGSDGAEAVAAEGVAPAEPAESAVLDASVEASLSHRVVAAA